METTTRATTTKTEGKENADASELNYDDEYDDSDSNDVDENSVSCCFFQRGLTWCGKKTLSSSKFRFHQFSNIQFVDKMF